MKKVAALVALALASVALIACGGGGGGTTTTTEAGAGGAGGEGAKTGGGGASTLKFEADPGGQLAYTTTHASTRVGDVTIEFENSQALQHDVAIENSSGEVVAKTDTVAEGTASTSASLKPGTYKFFCTVPGHRDAGMEGTLTVK